MSKSHHLIRFYLKVGKLRLSKEVAGDSGSGDKEAPQRLAPCTEGGAGWEGAPPPAAGGEQPPSSGAGRESVAQVAGCTRTGQGRKSGRGYGYSAPWEDESQPTCSGPWSGGGDALVSEAGMAPASES